MGNEENIARALQSLVRLIFVDTKERESGLHPSEISGCKRKAYYSLIGAEKRQAKMIEPRLLIGSIIHTLIQSSFESNGLYTVKSEIPIKDSAFARKYFMVGHCDMGFYVNGKPMLGVEIKSGTVPSTPMENHIMQATVYQVCLEFPFFWYFYMNRDGDKWKCFVRGAPEEKIVSEIETTALDIVSHAMMAKPPDPEPDFFQCRKICGYNHLCGRGA